jgi:hypothetical protein
MVDGTSRRIEPWPCVTLVAALVLIGAALAGCGGSASRPSGAAGVRATSAGGSPASARRGNTAVGKHASHRSGAMARRRSAPGSTARRAAEQFRRAVIGYVACLKREGVRVSYASDTKLGLPRLLGVDKRSPRLHAASKACRKVVQRALRTSG